MEPIGRGDFRRTCILREVIKELARLYLQIIVTFP